MFEVAEQHNAIGGIAYPNFVGRQMGWAMHRLLAHWAMARKTIAPGMLLPRHGLADASMIRPGIGVYIYSW